MGLFDMYKKVTQPVITSRIEITYEESPITEKQRQFLIDLGETDLPSTKEDATARLDSILAPYESAMKVCYRWWGNLERPIQRNLQITWRKNGYAERLPVDASQWTDEQRLEFMTFVRDTIGQEVAKELGPIGVKEKDGQLVLKPKRKSPQRKPIEIKFSCANCQQPYAAPEELANTRITCQSCQKELLVPRPKIGFYAAPSPSQLEEAELYKVTVPDGVHRGQLNEELQKARLDPARTPTEQDYELWNRRKTERHLRQADEKIQQIKTQLNAPNLAEDEVAKLKSAMEEVKAEKKSIIDFEREMAREERKMAREEERFRREEIQDLKEFRRDYIESEFNRGEDWAEFYRKPTRKQFDAIYDWLDARHPGWSGLVEVIEAIDVLFPELRKND